MERRVVLQAAAIAATAGLIGVMVQAAMLLSTGTTLQPTVPAVTLEQYQAPIRDMPRQMLIFFAGDTLFVLSYLLVYAGLYAVTAPRAPALAAVGLGAGVFGALCDATENAFMITYATLAAGNQPWGDPALPLIFIIANLKWMGALAAFAAFGLAFPRTDLLSWSVSILMLVPALIGAASVAVPAMQSVLGILLLVGMALFAAYFWRAFRREAIAAG